MKKYLLIIATAAIVASCTNQDTLKKDVQNGNDNAISFESYTSKQTRAENSTAGYGWEFFDHHNNFQVWGYKNTATVTNPVFNGDVVTVAEPDPTVTSPRVFTYTYSPLRFWDKAASEYEFYAAAPSDPYSSNNTSGWQFISSDIVTANIVNAEGQNKGYFTTKSSLTPSNIADGTATLFNTFKDVTDVDKMIAAPKAVPYAEFKDGPVQFNFIHILSRLNVSIKKDASLEPSDHKNQQKVVLKSLIVKNLLCAGDFEENKANPSSSDPGNNSRWLNQATAKDYTAYTTDDIEVATTTKYVIQSLVIPQDAPFEIIALDGAEHASTPATYYASVEEYNAAKGLTGDDAKDTNWWNNTATTDDKTKTPASTTTVKAATDGTEPYLVLTYTIQQTHDANGDEIDENDLKPAETFVAYFNLANAFGLQSGNLAFNEGWQNTLNITIKPATIEFCAKVAEWSTYERGVTVD